MTHTLTLLGTSIFVLIFVVLIFRFAEYMGEELNQGKISRSTAKKIAAAGVAVDLAIVGTLLVTPVHALFVLHFDLLFFALFLPFCFGLWRKAEK